LLAKADRVRVDREWGKMRRLLRDRRRQRQATGDTVVQDQAEPRVIVGMTGLSGGTWTPIYAASLSPLIGRMLFREFQAQQRGDA
jgi:hypothetical protein